MFSHLTLERVLAALVTIGSLSVVSAGPCDIYNAGGTKCVAAHSTTRALYDAYKGNLYEVVRSSDGKKKNITPLSNGIANAAEQDDFCAHTTCLISIIYDQSGHGNHLTQAPKGGAAEGPDANGRDYLASAIGAPVTLNGHKAYGVFSSPYTGYRNNAVKGTAKGDEPEGMYAVFDGTHYNSNCCFDYGNAETNSRDTGNGHMEAIYFGSGGSSSNGKGPWILGDLENGLIGGDTRHADPPSVNHRFVTAAIKGKPNLWSIRGGDATKSGALDTLFRGKRPAGGYSPMKKEGAIVLGIGGDNSDRAQGTFYEGVMTYGYPSDDTENKVQANIAAAKYGTAALTSGPKLTTGTYVSFHVTTSCCTNRYIGHNGDNVFAKIVSKSSSKLERQRASWKIHQGLGNSECFSFESVSSPGYFIRHYNYRLKLNKNDGSKLFAEDATFCSQAGLSGQGHSLRSWSYPTRYWRHYNAEGYIASDGGPHDFDAQAFYNQDVTFDMGTALAN